MKRKSIVPLILVIVAAAIWGTDSVVRYPTTLNADPRLIVLLEHFVGLIFILPIALLRSRKEISRLELRDLLPILVVGVGGASLGGLFSTKSIQVVGPSAGTLFQMLQPVFVIFLAHFFLKERRTATYFQCAIWVVFNYVLIGLSDQNLGMDFADPEKLKSGTGFGILAVMLWAMSTVAGKWLLFRFSPTLVVVFRFLTATVFMSALVVAGHVAIPWSELADFHVLLPCLFLGSIAGSISMLIYYTGLQRLPASLVTFIELIYPLSGALIPVLYSRSYLSFLQGVGILSLVVAVVFLVTTEYWTVDRVEPQTKLAK